MGTYQKNSCITLAEIQITNKFFIQPELLYTLQGSDTNITNPSFTLRTDYIAIPVMAKFCVAKNFNIELGPQIGFLLNAQLKSGNQSFDVKNLFNNTDFALNVGAGFDINKNVAFGARYVAGLNKIDANNTDPAKNSVFQLFIAYKL